MVVENGSWPLFAFQVSHRERNLRQILSYINYSHSFLFLTEFSGTFFQCESPILSTFPPFFHCFSSSLLPLFSAPSTLFSYS